MQGDHAASPDRADHRRTLRLILSVTFPLDRPDLTVVDALARMHLAARHAGGTIQLRRPSHQVQELLVLTGLDGVLTLAGEAGWQTELREQPGVDEAVDGRDGATRDLQHVDGERLGAVPSGGRTVLRKGRSAVGRHRYQA